MIAGGAGLTDRDRRVLALLVEHRVATAEQIARVEFPNATRARGRLYLLAERDGVLARFRPYYRPGSRPFYYTVGLIGAAITAAASGAPTPRPSDITQAVRRLEHSPSLPHRLGVVEFFTRLHAAARAMPGATLTRWWSAATTAPECYGVVRPDGYGEWTEHTQRGQRTVGFFFEFDRGTEPLKTILGKLDKYAVLARTRGITRPVLIELPTPARETNLHREITRRHGPRGHATVFVATTTTDHLNAGDQNPAGPVWRPAGTSGARHWLIALPALHHSGPVPL